MQVRSTAYFTVIPEKKNGSCIEVRLNSPLVKFKITNMADDQVNLMYRSNRSFHMPLPPGQPPGHLTFLKIIVQIPPYLGQNTVQMPHTRVHSGDQMPPPRGHFTGTKMTEGRRKRLQLSNKIFYKYNKN